MAAPRHQTKPRPTWLVALAGWAVPGLGHALLGQAWRGVAVASAVLGLFLGGLLIAGVRVVDLPGVADGRREMLAVPERQMEAWMAEQRRRPPEQREAPPEPRWRLTARPLNAVLSRPWFVAQSLAGPVAFFAGAGNVAAAQAGYPKPTARLADIGTLYCAAAGMMNLVALMDAASRASGRPA